MNVPGTDAVRPRPLTADSDTGNSAGEMRRQQLELVFRSTYGNQFLSPIVGAAMSAALWPAVDHRLLVGWVLTLGAVSVWRHLISRSRRILPADPGVARHCERLFLISLGVASAAWGIGAWLLMPAQQMAYEALIYCFVLGMAGGASALYSAHGPSAGLAISLIIGPSTLYMFAAGDTFHTVLGLGGLLFVLAAPRGARLLNDALQRNIALAEALDRLARDDPLSGLRNRRGFMELGDDVVTNAVRSARACALVMLDVDDFKSINDRFGHAVGDAVIAEVGAVLAASVRKGEAVGRIGGEEFAVLLPDSTVNEASTLARRILERVRALRIPAGGQEVDLTVSVGVAVAQGHATTLGGLLSRADAALYVAKRQGKDRVVVAPGDA